MPEIATENPLDVLARWVGHDVYYGDKRTARAFLRYERHHAPARSLAIAARYRRRYPGATTMTLKTREQAEDVALRLNLRFGRNIARAVKVARGWAVITRGDA